jgi:fructose-1,6-bisphosphatase I
MEEIVTIERFILDNQPESALGDFTHLLYDVALAAKAISAKARKAGLVNILGRAGRRNVQGEEQQKLDVYADKVLISLCDRAGRLCAMVSEEHKDIIAIPEQYPKGRYILVFDPLDGSSNIDVNISTGTVFGIYRCLDWENRGRLEDCLQPARDLVAAGYILYSTSTMLVYTTGAGVHGFTLDPELGEFLLSHEMIHMPARPRYYSVNSAYRGKWSDATTRYVDWLVSGGEVQGGLSVRYLGSLVADFHRNLLEGGVFLYPANETTPNGKLRLLYEAGPMAFLADQAGGYATDGTRPILDIRPTSLHQRVPLIVGDKRLASRAEAFV